jgi:hypothetical protein
MPVRTNKTEKGEVGQHGEKEERHGGTGVKNATGRRRR